MAMEVEIDNGMVPSAHSLNTESINYFDRLPTELLLEIFCYLRPFDVANILRVCSRHNAMMTERIAERLWTTATQNLCSELKLECCPPPPPKGMTATELVRLLFGIRCHCDACGKGGTFLEPEKLDIKERNRIDFARLHRVCEACESFVYYDTSTLLPSLPVIPGFCNADELKSNFMKMAVPYQRSHTGTAIWHTTDVNSILPELVVLQRRIYEGIEGAEAAKRAYIEARIAQAQLTRDFINKCKKWKWFGQSMETFCHFLANSRVTEIKGKVRSKFKKPYQPEDVEAVEMQGLLYNRNNKTGIRLYKKLDDQYVQEMIVPIMKPYIDENAKAREDAIQKRKEKEKEEQAKQEAEKARIEKKKRDKLWRKMHSLKCNHCPRSRRTYNHQGLRDHRKAVHNLKGPQ